MVLMYVAEHLGSDWDPSSGGMLAILVGGNLLWDFVILQKGNIMYSRPSVIDWFIFGNFHLNGIC